MAQLNARDVAYVYVAKGNRAATTILDPSSATYIAEGEIVLADLTGKHVTNTASTYQNKEKMTLVYRTDKGIQKSPVIKASNVVDYKVTAYEAPTDKVVYVGYNAVANSGSLEGGNFIAGTDYMINIRKLGMLDSYGHMCNFHKTFGYYNTVTGTDSLQNIVARGIVKNGVSNFSDKYGVDNFIKIEMVCNAALGGATSTQDVSFIEGSKLAIGTAGHSVVAGDYLRMTDAYTSSVYYVEKVETNNIYLETAFQDISVKTTVRRLTIAAGTAFGIRITGTTKTFNEADSKFRYDVPDFQITLKNFDNTLVTVTSNASLGTGEWKEIAQLERDAQDYKGQTSHTDWQMPSRKTYFDSTKNYDVLILRAYDDRKDTVAGTPKSFMNIFVPIPTDSNQRENAGANPVAMGAILALDSWLTANRAETYNEVANIT